jgi:4'-phosphopantetheinyl transferase
MIHWLVQSTTAAPEIAQGIAPAGLLSDTVVKRRQDWLLGRWTAKELVRMVLAAEFGVQAAPADVVILADPDGAPFVTLARAGATLLPGRQPWSLSISHSHGVAFCALIINQEGDAHAIGADIEFIEPRAGNFVGDFFTADEMALVRQATTDRDALVTAVWSAKEAVLKALRTGLRLDTRKIQCLIDGPLAVTDTWTEFTPTVPNAVAPGAQWSGWWRRPVEYADFVLTVVEKRDWKRKIED